MPALEQGIGRGDAGDAGSDDGDFAHDTLRDKGSQRTAFGPSICPRLSRYLRAWPGLPGEGRGRPLRWAPRGTSLQSVLNTRSGCLRVSWGVAPSAATRPSGQLALSRVSKRTAGISWHSLP